MKNTRIVCIALAMLMLSGCAVGVATSPESYPGYYASAESYPSHYASPSLVVIPGTYIYVAPDLGAEVYFHVGYWWRLSGGFWYRSHHHDRGWNRYQGVPDFYHQIDPGWRRYYAQRQWHGHPWKCERIPAHRVQQEWSRWETTRHWEKQNNWGVQGWRSAAQGQRIDSASPPARPDLREANRHQDYRTERVQRESAESRPQRLQNDRTRPDQSVRQSHNAWDQRDVVKTGPQRGEELRSRPERRQQDSVQQRAWEDMSRRGPDKRQPQDGRRWQAHSQRQEREEVTSQSPANRQSQADRRWQASPQRQSRQEMTQQSPEVSQPQEERNWQASTQRQLRQEITQQSPEASQPQEERNRQTAPQRQPRKEMTHLSPEVSQPQDGKESPIVLQQPDPENEMTQD